MKIKKKDSRLVITSRSGLLGVILLLGLCFSIVPAGKILATSGINEQLNYQARLLDSTGATVADGTYNLEFKIYQDGAGCETSGTPPCGGTLKWTETRTGSNKVTVKNGYFTVRLGSVNAFGNNVDWNQDTLWLSINVGGTSTPSWDGEMTPFRRLSASAYALNAKQLGGLEWSKFIQIAPSAVQTDSSTLSTLFLNKTGSSGNVLQLQKSGNDVLSVSNTGIVQIGTSDTTGALLVLDVKTDTGDPAGVEGGMYYNDNSNKFRCYQGSAWTDCISTGGGGGGTLQDAYTNSSSPATITTADGKNITFAIADTATDASLLVDLQCDTSCGAGGKFAIQNDGTDILSIFPTGAFSYQLPSGTSAAFQLLNGGAVPLFVIDTSTTRAYIGNPTADSTGALLVLDNKNTTGDPTGTAGAMYYNSTNNRFRCYQKTSWVDCVSYGGPGSFRFFSDFTGSPTTTGPDTFATNSGTSAATSTGTNVANNRPGVFRSTTGTTATGRSAYSSGTSAFALGGGITVFETAVNVTTLSTSTERFQHVIGLFDTATAANQVDAVAFVYDEGGASTGSTASANWQLLTASNSTRTWTTTSTAVAAGSWVKLRIEVNATANSVTYYINGTSVGTHTTNIPTGTSRALGYGWLLIKSVGTTARTSDFDYLATEMDYTTAR